MTTWYVLTGVLGLLVGLEGAVGSENADHGPVCQQIETSDKSNEIDPPHTSVLSCSQLNDMSLIFDQASDASKLVIENSNLTGNWSADHCKSLRSLSIKHSYVGISALAWIDSLPELQHLAIFNSWTHSVNDHSGKNITALQIKLSSLKNLKSLNISECKITNLDATSFSKNEVFPQLTLADNAFECSQNFLWLFNLHSKSLVKKRKRVDLNNTICFMEKMEENITFQALYTLRNKPFLAVMEYKQEVAVNCPERCNCEFIGMHTVDRPLLSVDCIGLNMTSLPHTVPKGSSRFNFTRNHITDLTPLYSNIRYRKVSFMDLSHNKITYLDPIKFVEVLKQQPRGVGFNLDHNELATFPAEVMLKVFQELKYMPQFFLGFNPYLCSCDYIKEFQQLIYYYLYDIKDARDIRCWENDPYNPGVMVLAVDTRELCDKAPLFHAMDLINVTLALVLIILIADFVYNYNQYRKNRKLPWIVTYFKC